MILTKRDLRTPMECLKDKVATVKLTRGDIVFINTMFGIMNQASEDPNYAAFNAQLGMLYSYEENQPRTMTLPFISPGLFKEHWLKFCEMMAEKQKGYLMEKHPEMFDKDGNMIQQPVPTPDTPVTSPFKDDTGIPVEAFDGTETVIVTRGGAVDAKAQPSEQPSVDPDQV